MQDGNCVFDDLKGASDDHTLRKLQKRKKHIR